MVIRFSRKFSESMPIVKNTPCPYDSSTTFVFVSEGPHDVTNWRTVENSVKINIYLHETGVHVPSGEKKSKRIVPGCEKWTGNAC